VGSYPIFPDGLTSTNYALTFSNGTLTVTAYALSVRADNQSRTYGATNPVFSGTITGLQNGDDITATYATTATESSPMGDYPITPTLVDPSGKLSNYAVSSTDGTLTVERATLTVTADPQSRAYGAANPTLTATITGFVNGHTLVSGVTGEPALATTATPGSDVGSYAIVPAVGSLSAANYSFSFVNGTLDVTPALLTGTAEDKSRLYGAANPPFTVSYTAFVNGQDASVVTGILSSSTPATTNSPAGGYAISAWGQSAPNYTMQYVAGTLTVEPAPLLVTGDDTSRAYGQANPVFSGMITGLQNGDDITATYVTTVTETSPVGTYPITPILADPSGKLPNYDVTLTNGTLSVTAPTTPTMLSIVRSDGTNIVITWASVSNRVYRVQYNADLTSTNWIDLTPDTTATDSTASFTDQPAGEVQRYYRVSLLP
jgi:hypothetical protein